MESDAKGDPSHDVKQKIFSVLKRDVQQISAVFLKNFHLQLRQTKTNLFQIFLPFVIVLCVLGLQVIYSLTGEIGLEDSVNKVNSGDEVFSPIVDMLELQNYLKHTFNFSNLADTVLYTEYSDTYLHLDHSKPFPNFESTSDVYGIDEMIYDELEKVDSNQSYPFRYLCGYSLHKTTKLHYIMQYDSDTLPQEEVTPGSYEDVFYTSVVPKSELCYAARGVFKVTTCEHFYISFMMDLVHDEYFRNMSGNRISVRSKVGQIPFRYVSEEVDFEIPVGTFECFFYSLILLLPMPMVIYTLVMEKEKTIKQMNKLMGMKLRNYYLATYMFYLLVTILLYMVLVVAAALIGARLIIHADLGLVLLILIVSALQTVSMGFFISSFFDKQVAVIISYIFILIYPFTATTVSRFIPERLFYQTLPVYLANVMPVMNLLLRIVNWCIEFKCPDFWVVVTEPKIYLMYLMGLLDAVIYLILGLYFEEIMPKRMGTKKHPLFFLNWLFKLCKWKKKKEEVFGENEDTDDEDVKNLVKDIKSGKINEQNQAVLIKGLVKKFGKNVVVKNLYLNVEKKKCLALLGPNGAGKTTTCNILVGMLKQTSGNAFINGSTINQIENIYDNVGLCPQFNILWEDFTARETLLYYSRIKGVNPKDQVNHVNEILKFIGLDKIEETKSTNAVENLWRKFFKTGQRVHEMSAGTKRKLSIGIALVGNPSLLILDEPTTGLDVEEMRKIWDLIALQKKERSILLTTHKMEECEVLGDRISILNRGRLICVGENIHLKEKYGSGYTLWLRVSDKDKSSEFVASLKDVDNTLIRSFGNILLYNINKKKGSESFSLSKLFNNIEENKGENGILDFEISSTTLESVFSNALKIDQQKKLLNQPLSITPSLRQKEQKELLEKKTEEIRFSKSSTKEATFLEKLKLTISENFFQIIFLLKKIWWVNINSNLKNCVNILAIVFWNLFSLVMVTLVIYAYSSDYYQHPSVHELDKTVPKCYSFDGEYCFKFTFALNNVAFAQDVLDEINLEGFEEDKDYKKFDLEIDMLNWMLDNPNSTNIGISFRDEVFFASTNTTQVQYVLYFNGTQQNTKLHRRPIDMINPLPSVKLMLDNVIYYLKQKERGVDVTKDNFVVEQKRFPKIFPKHQHTFKGDIQTLVFGRVMPIVLLIIWVTWVYDLSAEKEGKHKYFLQLVGVRKFAYFLSFFLQFFLYGMSCTLLYYLIGIVLQFDLFRYSEIWSILILFMMFYLAMIPLTFLIVSLFEKVRVALIFGFIVLGSTFAMSLGISGDVMLMLYSENISSLVPLILELIHPAYNLGKCINDITRITSPKFNTETLKWETGNKIFKVADFFESYDLNDSLDKYKIDNPVPAYSLLWLFVNFITFFILFLIFESVDFGGLYKKYVLKFFSKVENKTCEKYDDEEVQKEYDSIAKIKDDDYSLLTISDVHKSFYKKGYSKRVHAINSINIRVEKGSLSAIVGRNGAGKTTLCRLVQGELPVDKGKIFFKGIDISTSLRDVRKRIGVCNDYDFNWPQLTGYQHVKLFAELKGVSKDVIEEEVTSILQTVNLYEAKDEKVMNYSGGMKRRMMFALSLINSPELLILDEVTNGLDPDSTAEIWEVINELKKDRAILLTTNSMDEAENLADKIYIIQSGSVKVVGSSLRLKKAFGVGYNLKVICKDGKESELDEFVQKNIPHAVKTVENSGNFVYMVKSEYLSELVQGIALIESKEGDNLVKNFNIAFTTLEEIYFRIIPEEEESKKEEKSFSLSKVKKETELESVDVL